MYITITELCQDIPEIEAVNLCNDEERPQKSEENPEGWDLSASDDAVVIRLEQAIKDATEEINGYLRKRFTLPFENIPDRIKKLCKGITRYNLFSRRMADIPEGVLKQYQEIQTELEQIKNGEIEVELPPDKIYVSNKSSEDRVFTAEVLRQY